MINNESLLIRFKETKWFDKGWNYQIELQHGKVPYTKLASLFCSYSKIDYREKTKFLEELRSTLINEHLYKYNVSQLKVIEENLLKNRIEPFNILLNLRKSIETDESEPPTTDPKTINQFTEQSSPYHSSPSTKQENQPIMGRLNPHLQNTAPGEQPRTKVINTNPQYLKSSEVPPSRQAGYAELHIEKQDPSESKASTFGLSSSQSELKNEIVNQLLKRVSDLEESLTSLETRLNEVLEEKINSAITETATSINERIELLEAKENQKKEQLRHIELKARQEINLFKKTDIYQRISDYRAIFEDYDNGLIINLLSKEYQAIARRIEENCSIPDFAQIQQSLQFLNQDYPALKDLESLLKRYSGEMILTPEHPATKYAQACGYELILPHSGQRPDHREVEIVGEKPDSSLQRGYICEVEQPGLKKDDLVQLKAKVIIAT